MAAGWHSLPELNRAFAVGETAFLTARRRERYSRNKTARFSQAAGTGIALSRKESMILPYMFPFLIKHGIPAGIVRRIKAQQRLFRRVLFQSHGRQFIPSEPAAFRRFQIGLEGAALFFT